MYACNSGPGASVIIRKDEWMIREMEPSGLRKSPMILYSCCAISLCVSLLAISSQAQSVSSFERPSGVACPISQGCAKGRGLGWVTLRRLAQGVPLTDNG